MRLTIELNKADAIAVTPDYPTAGLAYITGDEGSQVDWVPALRKAAVFLRDTFNIVAAPALTNGPLPSNPDATQVEGFLGNCNTPPTEFGQVHVELTAYAQLRLAPQLLMMCPFLVIAGEAAGERVETITTDEGTAEVSTSVPVGRFA